MSTPEQNLADAVKKNLKPRGLLIQRLEDVSASGLPDAAYWGKGMDGAGFIEFKQEREWPKRHSTVIRLKHFTPQQKAWMQMNGPYIKKVFLLLRISTTFMLFPWTTIKNVGSLKRVDLIHLAECQGGCWGSRINYDELVKLLRRNYAKESRPFKRVCPIRPSQE